MKINIRTQALLLGATLLGTILFTGTPAAAVNITNTVDEASLAASNWNSSVWGTPKSVPLATTNYFIGLGSIRTEGTTAPQIFYGATLQPTTIGNFTAPARSQRRLAKTCSLLSAGEPQKTQRRLASAFLVAGFCTFGQSSFSCPASSSKIINSSKIIFGRGSLNPPCSSCRVMWPTILHLRNRCSLNLTMLPVVG